MSRIARDNRKRNPKTVESIELSSDHVKKRLLLTILLIAVGVSALVYAALSYIRKDDGITEITVNSPSEIVNSHEFVFLYELGATELGTLTEKRNVTKIYSDAMKTCYQDLNSLDQFEGVYNVAYLNAHPNEIVTVDAFLYHSLEKILSTNRRYFYLGPLYTEYQNLFFCKEDYEAEAFDPNRNEEERAYFEKIMSFAGSSEHIRLELLGNQQVRLFLSEEYMAFHEEVPFEQYVSFGLFQNALTIDYVAEKLVQSGYTNGTLSTYDGFMRTLDEREVDYELPVWNRDGQNVYEADCLVYQGVLSAVNFRNYPMNRLEDTRFYEYEDGTIVAGYLDDTDGYAKTSLNNLLLISDVGSCTDILLHGLPLYATEKWSDENFIQPYGYGLSAVYFEGSEMKTLW